MVRPLGLSAKNFLYYKNFNKLGQHVEEPFITLGQVATAFYFVWFLVLVPAIGIIENTLMDLAEEPSNNISNSKTNMDLKKKHVNFSYKYSYNFALLPIGAISLNSNDITNFNLMKFINFFNSYNLIILGGSLGLILLGLFILYKNSKNNNLDTSSLSNTSSSSDASSSLSSTDNPNNNSNNESYTDGRERIDRAVNYATGTFGVAATVITALEGVPTMIGIGTSLGFGLAAFALGYNLNSDQEESQVQINRVESPPQDINLNPHGHERLLNFFEDSSPNSNLIHSDENLNISFSTSDSTENLIVDSLREKNVSENAVKVQDINSSNSSENAVKVQDINSSNSPENPYNVLSPNEDDNNLLNLIWKFFEFIEKGENNIKEFFYSLIPNDGDPTMFYLFSMSVILCCIFVNLLFIFLSLFLKRLKVEEKEFVKNRPLLYKLTINYTKIKDIKIIVFLILTIILLASVLIICNFMWDSYWYYK